MKLKFGFLLGLALSLTTAWPAVVVNDGTTTNNLARLINEYGRGEADTSLVVNNSELEASQAGTADSFAVRTAWYALTFFPTSSVYSVSADFRPADVTADQRGGVMGWLDIGATNRRGISFQVQPGGPEASFKVRVVDFDTTDRNANEILAGLFNPADGTPATEEFTSAGAELGTNYVATNSATFQLEFAQPTTTVVTNATARITAKVFQGVDTGGAPIQVSRTIELLTDLPVPDANHHRFGYFAYWASIFAEGQTIGYLDNLNGSGVDQVPNLPPTVAITNPVTGATFNEPATITISAIASDSDGTVTTVEFYAGTNLLGTVTSAPFDFIWTNVSAGSYSLTARAIDNLGGTATSTPVSTTVNSGTGTGPQLTIVQKGNSIEICWASGGYQLQVKTNLSALAWTDVPNTVNTNCVTLPISSEQMFFRLVQAGASTGPRLTVQLSGNTISVSWPQVTGYRLQARNDLATGTWTDVAASNNQYSEAVAGTSRFFRLISP